MYCISIDVLYANEKGIIIYGYIAYMWAFYVGIVIGLGVKAIVVTASIMIDIYSISKNVVD